MKPAEEIKINSQSELSDEQFKVFRSKQLKVTKAKLENAEKQFNTIIEKLKNFIEELCTIQSKTEINDHYLTVICFRIGLYYCSLTILLRLGNSKLFQFSNY